MECLPAAAERPTPARPVGGFRFVTTTQIAMAWAALVNKQIRYRAFRVYWACHELVERRRAYENGCKRAREKPAGKQKFTLQELHRLVGGVGGAHLRADLRVLEHVGLLRWSESNIWFAEGPDELRDPAPALSMLARIGSRCRRVPIPRQTIRFIAGGARRVAVSTMLGHLIRCVFYKGNNRCSAEGSCAASWVGRVFGVSRANVVEARVHLESIGWLQRIESDHWHRQRYGGRAVVNLAWKRPVAHDRLVCRDGTEQPGSGGGTAQPATESRPRRTVSATELRPPDSNVKLLAEYKNQEPAKRGPTGASSKETSKKKATMRHVVPEDLSDTARTFELFEDAKRCGYVRGSEADRLRIFAAVEHARTVGDRNPCGLFSWLVRGERWQYITQSDEDAAQVRLKRFLFGTERGEAKRPVAVAPPSMALSEDARFVGAVRQMLARERYQGDAFHAVRREYPEWTRERWEQAVAELENARLRRVSSLAAATA